MLVTMVRIIKFYIGQITESYFIGSEVDKVKKYLRLQVNSMTKRKEYIERNQSSKIRTYYLGGYPKKHE